jgi:hypothetical protein
MIFVGLDDTDMPDTPGTNKLAFHLAELLERDYVTQWIVRHQLLADPRIPCTNKNGCVTMLLEPREAVARHVEAARARLIACIRATMLAWCPPGSDPGLCVADEVAPAIAAWGKAAQSEVLLKEDALRLASETGVHLEELGGTGGGVIGALAAVGLLSAWDGGRVVHCAKFAPASFDATGCFEIDEVYQWGVDEVVCMTDGKRVTDGWIDLGKRLRPNLRGGRAVLYVEPGSPNERADWLALRVVE